MIRAAIISPLRAASTTAATTFSTSSCISCSVWAYRNRSGTYAKKGEYDRAIADFDKAIELDPKYAGAYNSRAMVFFTDGKPAQGLPDVEKSLELHPDDPNALDTRGLIFEALGRKQEAIADFRRALAMAPNLQSSKDALKRLGALGTP
jgi:tetratricopeptide (TPR) repeat protein